MDIKKLFPNASRDTVAANSIPLDSLIEQPAGETLLDSYQRKAGNSRSCVLCYTSRRVRLLDEDNLCTKYFTDALRYCGALQNDSPDKVTIWVRQEKVAHRSQEATIIDLLY